MLIKDLKYSALIMPAILDEGTPKERSLWPEFMPLRTKTINSIKIKGLLDIKADIGSLIFGLQYQNDTKLQESGTIFKWEWFNFYRGEDLPKRLKIYQGADLAISKKDTADYFVILTLGIDELGNVYIIDIFRTRGLSFRAQVEAVIKKAEEWKPIKIGIENNSYQAALAQEVERLSLLPVIELTTIKDKILRAQIRSGLVEGGRVYVKPDMHSFVSELTLLDASVEHDDMFDAFDFALTVAETKASDAIQEGYYQPEFDYNAAIF
jgi:predicted phage terminase large subunit-like protein